MRVYPEANIHGLGISNMGFPITPVIGEHIIGNPIIKTMTLGG